MKKKSKGLILSVVFSIIVISSFGQSGIVIKADQSSDADTIITKDSNSVHIEKSATFMGGGIEVFRDWVQTNLIYSPIAVKQKIFGRVFVKFSIDENGKLYHAEIYQGVHPLLDNETLRVIQSSPLWEPATINGQNVKQSFIMPVIFVLTNKFIKSHSK